MKAESMLEKQNIQLTRIEEKLSHGNREFEELNRYLKGNGQPGMLERVSKVEGKFILLWTILTLLVAAILAASLTHLI